MAKRKGLSVDEKRERMLAFMHEKVLSFLLYRYYLILLIFEL